MFKALYDYAKQHPEIRVLPGTELRTISYVVDLTSDGKLIGVRAVDKKDSKVNCPSAGSIGSKVDAHPIAERAKISLCVDEPEEEEDPKKALEKKQKLNQKRAIFLQRFEDGKEAVPAFRAVIHAMTDKGVLAEIQNAYLQAKGKPDICVGFSVDGVDLWEMPEVFEWWCKPPKEEGPYTALDMITGKPCVPLRFWKRMPKAAAPGGQPSGCYLLSFNGPVFNSYGNSNGENCPVAEETANAIIDAAIHLSLKAPLIGNVKLLHWYAGKVEQKDDVLAYILDGWGSSKDDDDKEGKENEEAMDATADALLTSPFTGTPPPELAGMKFHIAYLQPQAARIITRRYEKGNYAEVYRSVSSWFDSLRIVSSTGYLSPNLPKLKSMLLALLTDAEMAVKDDPEKGRSKLSPLNPHLDSILDSCFFGTPLPDAIGYRALSNFRSGMYPRGGNSINWGKQYRLMQWIKLWLNRYVKEGGNENMPQIDVHLDEKSTNPAYICGRLMAVYDMIQRQAADRNVTVVSRFFSACSQAPLQVLGRLQELSVHHLAAIQNGYMQHMLSKELQECWSMVTGSIPNSLSIPDQAYFACGYWQERAAFKRKLAENAKKKTTSEEEKVNE